MKLNIAKTTLAIMAFSLILLIGASVQASHQDTIGVYGLDNSTINYFKASPMTASELVEKWGRPVKTENWGNGVSKITFDPYSGNSDHFQYIIKDGKVVGRGLNSTLKNPMNSNAQG